MQSQPTPSLRGRQLWDGFVSTDLAATSPTPTMDCSPVTLSAGGFISINSAYTISLTSDGVFLPACTNPCNVAVDGSDACVLDSREPFYASSTPLIYVVATTTVIAWTLLIILLITPRTFSLFSRGRASALVAGRSVISALAGRSSVFATGSRPWLQKVAALMVAISLTVATANTFEVAERQYARGIQSADNLREEVTNSTEIRVLRVVSDLFLWLAQVQTLTRLFPRHKEKLLIKWIGFLLILCDIIFSCLNNFWIVADFSDPSNFNDAISALSYLFQLALSLLYATWVFYYAVTKRRYAFYHEKMPNVCIVALLSCVSVSIPVAFFIADLLVSGIAGWGDYFRWVGAAAASILVWEWVERIEAIERDEKKDGILGREIFDGDEMLDNTPSDSNGRGRSVRSQTSSSDPSSRTGVIPRLRKYVKFAAHGPAHDIEGKAEKMNGNTFNHQPNGIASLPPHVVDVGRPADTHKDTDESTEPPEPIHTPIDRSNAASAESTVYTVRYHPVMNTPPVPPVHHTTATPTPSKDTTTSTATTTVPQTRTAETRGRTAQATNSNPPDQVDRRTRPNDPSLSSRQRTSINSASRSRRPFGRMGHFAANTFRRSRRSPPLEVKNAMSLDEVAAIGSVVPVSAPASSAGAAQDRQRNGLIARFAGVGSGDTSRRTSINAGRDHGLPTVIPAPPRGHTWSPDEARHSPMDTITSSGTPGPTHSAAAGEGDGTTVHPAGSDGVAAAVGTGPGVQPSTTDILHFPTSVRISLGSLDHQVEQHIEQSSAAPSPPPTAPATGVPGTSSESDPSRSPQ